MRTLLHTSNDPEYLLLVRPLSTLSGNFQKSEINTELGIMIHHQKGKNLNFTMSYVRLRKIKPV